VLQDTQQCLSGWRQPHNAPYAVPGIRKGPPSRDTTYAGCSPVLLIWGILYVFSCYELCLVMLVGLVHGEFSVISIIRVVGYTTVPNWLMTAAILDPPSRHTTYAVCSPVL